MTGNGVRLEFEFGFGEREAVEALARGYQSHVRAILGDGSAYSIVFYDPVRLAQDVAQEQLHGRPFVAEPGLIVVTQITPANMMTAVTYLANIGYFNHLQPDR